MCVLKATVLDLLVDVQGLKGIIEGLGLEGTCSSLRVGGTLFPQPLSTGSGKKICSWNLVWKHKGKQNQQGEGLEMPPI